MVYTWCTHVQQRLRSMTSGHMYMAWWPYGRWVIGHEVEAWTLGQEKRSCSMDQYYNYLSRDSSCKEFFIEFSYVNPIQGSSPKPTLRFLSCNMRSVTLYAFWALNSARESQMTPFPTVFTLRNARVRISHSNCHNIPSDVEISINKTFSLDSALCIPNVDPHNSHIRLQWHFDYPRFGGKGNVVEDMILLYDVFDVVLCDTLLRIVASMWIIWDTDDLEVWLWLW